MAASQKGDISGPVLYLARGNLRSRRGTRVEVTESEVEREQNELHEMMSRYDRAPRNYQAERSFFSETLYGGCETKNL